MGKTSRERSHSKISNFKLTLIALIAILGFNLVFIGLALFNYNQTLSIILMSISGVVSLLSYFLITRFTR